MRLVNCLVIVHTVDNSKDVLWNLVWYLSLGSRSSPLGFPMAQWPSKSDGRVGGHRVALFHHKIPLSRPPGSHPQICNMIPPDQSESRNYYECYIWEQMEGWLVGSRFTLWHTCNRWYSGYFLASVKSCCLIVIRGVSLRHSRLTIIPRMRER